MDTMERIKGANALNEKKYDAQTFEMAFDAMVFLRKLST